MNKIIDKIILFVFSKTPIVKWASGYKRSIGNALQVVGGILALLTVNFPEIPHLDQAIAFTTLVSGYFIKLFGDMHADAKDRK